MQSPDYIISSCTLDFSAVTTFNVDAPTPGDVYFLTFVGSTPNGCYSVIDTSTDEPTDVVESQILFDNCELCNPITGISVNNQYEYTNDCCDSVSGNTGPGKPYPHPIDTNAYGVGYVQLNAVVIGGVNGLNN